MSKDLDYGPEQVTRALLEVVAKGGNCERAAEELLDDEFMVPAATLRRWKRETHAEQYRRLEEEYGRDLERQTVEHTRRNVARAAEIERDLIEKMASVPAEQQPQALRALADAKAKGIDKILALTGRSQPAPQANEFATLLAGMVEKGYARMHVSLEAGSPTPVGETVDGTADEVEPGD